MQEYLKAFMAGMILPSIIAPFIIAYFIYTEQSIVLERLPFIYFGAIFWGLWNMVFVATRKKVPIVNRNAKIGVYGAFYGLIAALINSLYFEFTSVIPAFTDIFILVAIIGYPVLLYFVWKYVVNSLNLIFEIY